MAIDDTALEREIEGLLGVDPAPDFRASLRQRLAQEPPLHAGRPMWHVMWAIAGSGLIGAAATTIVLLLRVDALPPVPTAPPPPVIDVAVMAAPTAVRRTISPKRLRPASPAPMNVIVHAPEAAAWRQLLADVRSGDVGLSPLTRATDESTSPPISEEFLLPRIVIEPLAPELAQQGVRP